jgi:hypothetical protein
MTDAISLFNYAGASNDREGMIIAARSERLRGSMSSNDAAWVHSIAVRYNNPIQPITAAREFTATMQELAEYVVSVEAGADRWTKDNGFRADFSLTGNTVIANAYKRILGAMKLGGDLVCNDSKKGDIGNHLKNVGLCAAFVAKQNKLDATAKEDALAIQELHDFITESTGHAEGTPEHDEAFKKASVTKAVDNTSTTTVTPADAGDEYDAMGREYAETMRKYGELDANSVKARHESMINKVKGSVETLLERLGTHKKSA